MSANYYPLVLLFLLCFPGNVLGLANSTDVMPEEFYRGMCDFLNDHSILEAERQIDDPGFRGLHIQRISGASCQLIDVAIEDDDVLFYREMVSVGGGRQLNVGINGAATGGVGKSLDAIAAIGENVNVSLRSASDFRKNFTLLTGFFVGSNATLQEIARTGTVVDRTTIKIHKYDCEVFTLNHDAGTYTVALCERLGYAPLRIEVVKKGHNLHLGKQLSRSGVVQYRKEYSYGDFDPDFSSFTLKFQSHRDFSKSPRSTKESETRWRVKPLTKPIELQVSIPEGTKVVLSDSRQIQAIWKNGSVEVLRDKDFETTLQSASFEPTKQQAPVLLVLAITLLGGSVAFLFFLSQRSK